jgi:hypothetical protein
VRNAGYPWPRKDTLRVAREMWWAWSQLQRLRDSSGLLVGPSVERAQKRLLLGLEQIHRGRAPSPRAVRVPLELEFLGRGRVKWALGLAENQHEVVAFALAILQDRDVRDHLRRCTQCKLIYLPKKDPSGKRSYCSDEHRHAWNNAHRDRKQWAAYMRDFRRKYPLQRKRAK